MLPSVFPFLPALIVADEPYGLNVESWDSEHWDEGMHETILRGVRAICTSNSWVWASWVHWRHMGMVERVLGQEGYGDVSAYFWHKPGLNYMPPHPSLFSHSVETMVVGYYPKASAVQAFFPNNPLERHNFQDVAPLRKYVTLADGKTRLNAHEKPEGALERILRFFSPPESNVLVLGAGAGGEVRACLRAGCNVVAVEQDPVQFAQLKKQMEGWDEDRAYLDEKAAGKGAVEADEQEEEQAELQCQCCGNYQQSSEELAACVQCSTMVCVASCLSEGATSPCLGCKAVQPAAAEETAETSAADDQPAQEASESPRKRAKK